MRTLSCNLKQNPLEREKKESKVQFYHKEMDDVVLSSGHQMAAEQSAASCVWSDAELSITFEL